MAKWPSKKKGLFLSNVPGNYIKINSGLGEAKPANLIILPVLFENKVKAVIELASLDIIQRNAPGLPEPADRKYRYRVKYH